MSTVIYMSQNKTIGDRIRAVREEKSLSLDELGRLSGLTGAHIGRLERNEEKYSNPTVGTVEILAKALEVHPSMLLFGKVLEPELELKKEPGEFDNLTKDEKDIVRAFRNIKYKQLREMAKSTVKKFGAKMDIAWGGDRVDD